MADYQEEYNLSSPHVLPFFSIFPWNTNIVMQFPEKKRKEKLNLWNNIFGETKSS
jgi:hypothetical protein